MYSLDIGQSPFVRFKKMLSPYLPTVGPYYFDDQEDLKCAFSFGKGIHNGTVPDYLENKPPVKINPARFSSFSIIFHHHKQLKFQTQS